MILNRKVYSIIAVLLCLYISEAIAKDVNTKTTLFALPRFIRAQGDYANYEEVYKKFKITKADNIKFPKNIKDKYPVYLLIRPKFDKNFIEGFFGIVFNELPYKTANGDMAVHVRTKKDLPNEGISFYKGGKIHIKIRDSNQDNKNKTNEQGVRNSINSFLDKLKLNKFDFEQAYFSFNNSGASAKYFTKVNGLFVADNAITIYAQSNGFIDSAYLNFNFLFELSTYPILSVDEAIEEVLKGNGYFSGDSIPLQPIVGKITEVKLFYASGIILGSTPYIQPVYSFRIKFDKRLGDAEETWIDVQAIRPEFIREENDAEKKQP